ncbi:MAG: FtsL-like putative cell division protein [Bacteroidia bacterium]|nr:FtsL-like putative cell division protein [Bacteroidia bacterium]
MINRTPNGKAAVPAAAAAAGKRKGLSVRKVDDYLRFSFFLVLIGMGYIWNSYQAERQIKRMEGYEKEVKSLKSRFLLQQATLNAGTRYSEIRQWADTLGLQASREPAYRLVRGLDMPLSRLDVPVRNPLQRFEEIAPDSLPAPVPDADTLFPDSLLLADSLYARPAAADPSLRAPAPVPPRTPTP